MKVIVIGAGVVGSLIARELSRYELELTIIEQNLDVGWGATKANSAIVHAGYDDPPGSVRSQFCSKGNYMYTKLSEELDFEIKRTGSYVVAFNDEELEILKKLLKQGHINNVPDLEIHEGKTVIQREPELNPDIQYGLWAPTAGITEPWEITTAAVENAVANGANLILGEKVVDFEKHRSKITEIITQKRVYRTDLVVNTGGIFADEIAQLAGAEYVPLYPRRGEYIVLDKGAGSAIKSVIFPSPTTVSKGILVVPTVNGEILLGPTAVDLPSDMKNSVRTTKKGLNRVKRFAKSLVPSLDFSRVIKTFAGLRPENPQRDFFIRASKRVPNFINVMAMRSPGLTAAPAVAEYVVEEIIQQKLKFKLSKKRDFNPTRNRIRRFAELPLEKWREAIRNNPAAGRLVCHCKKVTEAEIVEAIRRGSRTLDGVKFRTRAMFGRCQGGFCSINIMKILTRELGIDMSQLKMKSPNSWIVGRRVRE